MTTLGDFIYVKHGFAFKGEHFVDTPTSDVVVTPDNFSIGGGFQPDKAKYYDGPVPDNYILYPGDLIVTMTDLSKAGDTLGYPAIVPDSVVRYLHNQRIGLVQIKEDADADRRFLFYRLCANDYRHHILATASGSTVRHTSPGRICEFETELPPLDEQRAIAGVLGALDDKIEQNRRTARVLERLARAIFRAWFIDFLPVKAKSQTGRGGAAGETAFPSMPPDVFDTLPTGFQDSELGSIPQGWEVKPLDDVCDVNARSIRKGDLEGKIEYVNISSVTRGHLDEIERVDFADAPSRARRLIQDGDTIWSCVRPNRMSYLYIHDPPENRIVSTGFAVLTPKEIGPSFLYQLTTQPEFVEYLVANATGSAYPAVRGDHFETAKFCCPPSDVLDAFEAMTQPMRRWIGEAERESRKLAELRDYLLPRLLSGKVRV